MKTERIEPGMGLIARLFHKNKNSRPFCAAIVPAAGSSSRMEGVNKIFASLAGKPVLAYTLAALDTCALVDEIVIATRKESIVPIQDLCRRYDIRKPVKIVEGGQSRTESVMRAAQECNPLADFIAVHDGARPLADAALIAAVIQKAYTCNAAAPAVAVKDTIKVAKDGRVEDTPERSSLFAVQTPQVFDASLLKAALQAAIGADAILTDDCSAVERIGKFVYLIDGTEENIKITTPMDLLVAEKIIETRSAGL